MLVIGHLGVVKTIADHIFLINEKASAATSIMSAWILAAFAHPLYVPLDPLTIRASSYLEKFLANSGFNARLSPLVICSEYPSSLFLFTHCPAIESSYRLEPS